MNDNIIRVRFDGNSKEYHYYCDYGNPYPVGQQVVMRTSLGIAEGRVVGYGRTGGYSGPIKRFEKNLMQLPETKNNTLQPVISGWDDWSGIR